MLRACFFCKTRGKQHWRERTDLDHGVVTARTTKLLRHISRCHEARVTALDPLTNALDAQPLDALQPQAHLKEHVLHRIVCSDTRDRRLLLSPDRRVYLLFVGIPPLGLGGRADIVGRDPLALVVSFGLAVTSGRLGRLVCVCVYGENKQTFVSIPP